MGRSTRIAGILSVLAFALFSTGCSTNRPDLSELTFEQAKQLERAAMTLPEIPVCMVAGNDGSSGSAVLLNENTLLSCKHVFRREPDKLSIRRTPQDEWLEVGATLLCQGKADGWEDDWSVYRLDVDVKLPDNPVPLDFDYDPREGDEVLLVGYPSENELPGVPSMLLGTVAADQPVPWYLRLFVTRFPQGDWAMYVDTGPSNSRPLYYGYSGGPAIVFNAFGCNPRIVGIVSKGFLRYRGSDLGPDLTIHLLPKEAKQFLTQESEPE